MSRQLTAVCGLSAAVIGSTLTGCSTGDSSADATTPVAGEQAPVTAPQPPLLSAEAVTRLMARMLDPAVPNSDKTDSVQGIAADPGLPNRVAESPGRNGAQISVTITTTRLGTPGMLAEGTGALNNGVPQPLIVNFVAEDGKWKIEKAWYCQIAYSMMVTSPACPA